MDIDQIRSGLDYDQETGKLVWKMGRRSGSPAGTVTKKGYVRVKLDKNYMAHRIIWAMFYGYWPKNMIDHIDGDRSNNRISNLREATPSQNAINSKIKSTNSCGVKGIYKKNNVWVVQINGKYAGSYKTMAEATSVRALLEDQQFGEWKYKGLRDASI